MIFSGDVAIATGDRFYFCGFPKTLVALPWCLNLEGAIAPLEASLPAWGVVNTAGWTASFTGFNLGPVFIGNNHLHDIADGVQSTLTALAKRGLVGFGAGVSVNEAAQAVEMRSCSHNYRLLGFGWPVIGCQVAGISRPGVSWLEASYVLTCAEALLHLSGPVRVVVVMHGNYEFERYPQPGHRILSKSLIDLGVHAVIWHHPHIVGPVERYKGRTIAYSLGNWAFSYGKFFGGRLRFPESSFQQIAVQLGDTGDLVHHARFEPPTTVTYQRQERIEAADFSLRPPFEGFTDEEYFQWFKAYRIKRKGLPIYRDAADSLSNRFRDRWVGFRQLLIDTAAKSGLKAIRRSDNTCA